MVIIVKQSVVNKLKKCCGRFFCPVSGKKVPTPPVVGHFASATLHAAPFARDCISRNALNVVRRLQGRGYQAYLVGGCIRDILLGYFPKDFDVATDAHPEVVRHLFRNSRIIGRRFKLIHVVFGREIIEVATFRAHHEGSSADTPHLVQDHQGRLLRDNVYGRIEDDAARRDFTINALYYKEETEQIIDFSGGMIDIQGKVLRLLGDPKTRYCEDPVRMLRVVRFSAKLQCTIEEGTRAPIAHMADLLCNIPAARLFDEVLKLFLNGASHAAFCQLWPLRLFEQLFPSIGVMTDNIKQAKRLIELVLLNTDRRIKEEKYVTPAFLFAAILWHPLQQNLLIVQKKWQKISFVEALEWAVDDVLREQCRVTAIPKRFTYVVRDIWLLQHDLVEHQIDEIEEIVQHAKFRAAYDFLLLREESGETLNRAGDWWTVYQEKHVIPKSFDNRFRKKGKKLKKKYAPKGTLKKCR